MKVTEGKLHNIGYGSIKVRETIGNKVVVDSAQEIALIVLDTGESFPVSTKTGEEVHSWGTGQSIRITQDKGTITIERL